ncbi:MAG: PBP1A family penicillin-binding protein [Candidatus Shapirobacteria bacterium]
MLLLQTIAAILVSIGKPAYRTITFLVNFSNKFGSKFLSFLNKFWRFLKTKKIKKLKIKFNLNFKIKWKYFWILFLLILFVGGGYLFYLKIIKDLPSVDQIYNAPRMSTKIVDRNGNLLYKFYEDENRSWVPLNRIPDSLVKATLAIEDKDFYKHHGISFKGLSQAIIYNFKKTPENKLRGGSTLTQQLVKNIYFTNEKSFKRKFKEAVLTLLVESKLSKNEILEKYFNQVSYGGEAYGVQEASLKYFGKNVWEINDGEASYLAGLPAAPSSFSPFSNNPEYGYARQKRVVEEMLKAKFISQEKADELNNNKVSIIKYKKKIKAPHFVFYIKNLLEQKYNFENVGRLGLTVTTSLDPEIQDLSEKVVLEELDKVKKLNITNGAALVIDVKNGDILAMVGSKDYNALDIDGEFNVTTALRQPGSSIKPINYLLALENGFNLTSTINDSPITYYVAGQKPYSPKNYNGKYMGTVTLKTALASSLNIPSVKLLAKNGVAKMIDLGESMGISTWKDRDRYGLSLALGSGEVKMTELAGAYSIFANSGKKIEINPVLKIEDYLGKTIYEKKVEEKEIIKEKYTFLINSALSDNQARSPIFGKNSLLNIPEKTVAVKTGTTNNLKDNWCIGWTPSYLTAVWVGNNDSSPMSWVASGVSGATPIWNRIISGILKDKKNEGWQIPNNLSLKD